MTYATIEEAFGGISGSTMLNSQLANRRHPLHQKRIDEENYKRNLRQQRLTSKGQDVEHYPTNPSSESSSSSNKYMCNYYDGSTCDQVVARNNQYNQLQKDIAQGTPGYNNAFEAPYTMFPQYPWYPQAQAGYLMYSPYISSQWYNNPYGYAPDVAKQIQMYQMRNPNTLMVPTGHYNMNQSGFIPYAPNTFFPNLPYGGPNPNIGSNQGQGQGQIEHFTNLKIGNNTWTPAQVCLSFFFFFLITLAIILCLIMFAMHQRMYNRFNFNNQT